MTIDWQYQTECYNRINKTNYHTPRVLLESLYRDLGTCVKVADELSVASNSIHSKMKSEKLKLNQKGWPKSSCCETAIINFFKETNLKDLTAKEIARAIGFSENYTRAVLEKMGINYKKLWIRSKKI